MGNQLTVVPTQIYSVEDYFSVLPEYEFLARMSSTRFLKTARARYKDGYVVVKVFPRTDRALLQTYEDKVKAITEALAGCPGVITYPKTIVTDRSGILIRQFIWSNLYDRMNLRPFLAPIEKHWIVYQCLRSLEFSHARGVCHGDIKTENILLTSWNWVLLTDFACYKPVELLEDNPAAFSFYYDTARRRNCYIAPERFTSQGHGTTPLLDPSMDIFSLGCVIAELFLDGTQLFNLHQLISYKRGQYNTDKVLECIENKEIIRLIKSMTSWEPSERLSASSYINEFCDLFPPYFNFLYNFTKVFISPVFNNSDQKISFIFQNLKNLLEKLHSDPGRLGHVIVLSSVTSCIRGLQRHSSKIQSLDILVLLSGLLPDDIVIDRIIPHVLYFTTDTSPNIRATSLVCLTKCLKTVSCLPATDFNIFPEYIFPIVNKLSTDPEKLVQRVFAEQIGELAEYAINFLEISPPANFDTELSALHSLVQVPVVHILTGEDYIARRILLEKCITQLCVFFGQQKANDLILSHMITFLNNKTDWRLRAAFFDCVVGVAAFVGWHSLNMLKPLLQQGLADVEEFVVSKTLSALISLSQLGLLEEKLMYELVVETSPLLCHPNLWIRYRTVGFISSSCRQLHIADVYCKILPKLHQILALPVRNPDNERAVLQTLPDPLPRALLDFLVNCSLCDKIISYLNKPTEDVPPDMKSSLEKLRNLGMTSEEESKILHLQDYILKVHTCKKSMTDEELFVDIVDGAILLQDSDIMTYDYNSNIEVKDTPDKPLSPSRSFKSSQSTRSLKHQQSIISSQSLDVVPNTGIASSRTSTINSDTVDLTNDPMFSSLNIEIDTTTLTQNTQTDLLQGLLSRKQAEYIRTRRAVKPTLLPGDSWVPKGILVCHIHEHKASINKVKFSAKDSILATSSDDGCVKIWNARRFDSKNIINNSRHTYSRQSQPIKGMAFYDTGDKIAAITRNGSLHEVGVKELKVYAARMIALEPDDVIIDMHTLGIGQEQTLVISTCDGKIIGVDVRSPTAIFKLSNNPSYGASSAMCTDVNEHWMCIGTRSGWITCWDLRFRLPITSWQHDSAGGGILDLKPNPISMSSIYVAVDNSPEVGVWNIESSSKERMLWYGEYEPFQSSSSSNGVSSLLPLGGEVVVTGGIDHVIRYWNTSQHTQSYTLAAPPDTPTTYTYGKKIVKNVEVIYMEAASPLLTSTSITQKDMNPSRPSPAHHQMITDMTFCKATQPFLITVDMGGVMKIWK